jgi:diacylglycerol kinase family enzyme
MFGTLHKRRDIEIVPATRIRVEGASGSPVHGDGDILAALPLDISMDPKGMELIVPESFRTG